MKKIIRIVSCILAFLIPQINAAEPNSSEVISKTGVNGGLVIQLGASSGSLISDLALTGKFHAYGIVMSNSELNAARLKVLQSGVPTLAIVQKAMRLNPLPFPSDFANLVIADLDLTEYQNISQIEIDRITAPLGASYVKKGGIWSVKKKPLVGMDDWSHYDKDFTNSQVSMDSKIGVCRTTKWYGGQKDWSGWPVFSDGKMVGRPRGDGGAIECRDAFNGVRLWRIKGVNHIANNNNYPLVFTNNKVYYPVDGAEGYVWQIDANTGKLIRKLSNGGKFTLKCILPTSGGVIDYATSANMMLVVAKGKIIQTVRGTIYCLNENDGSLLWSQNFAPDSVLSYPTIDTTHNRVYFGAGTWLGSGRNFHAQVNVVYAYDLLTGKKIWEQREYGTGKIGLPPGNYNPPRVLVDTTYTQRHLSQIMYGDGALILFNHSTIASNIGNAHVSDDRRVFSTEAKVAGLGYLGRLNPEDGKVMWIKHFTDFDFMNTTSRAFIWKGKAYHVNGGGVQIYELSNGTQVRTDTIRPYYLSDPRTYKVPNKMLYYPTAANCSSPAFLHDKCYSGGTYADFVKFQYCSFLVNVSMCASKAFPAFGSMYVGGSNTCKCLKQWRGWTALNSDSLDPDIPESSRLDNSTIDAQKQTFPLAPITNTNIIFYDVRQNDINPFYGKDSIMKTLGSTTFISWCKLHRLDAQNGNTLQWSFTTGGRICAAPVEFEGNIFFGSTDGYVYSLEKSTGKQRWRFYVGPDDRHIVTFSQVESAYPVFGVALVNGTIYASAGRVIEADKGIWVYGLNPSTGTVMSKLNFHTPPKWMSMKNDFVQKDFPGTVRSKFINGPLTANGNSLTIQFYDEATGTSGKREGNSGWQGFVFDPVTLNGTINPNSMATGATGTEKPFTDQPSIAQPDFQTATISLYYTPLKNMMLNKNPVGSIVLNGHHNLLLREPGMYTISVTNALGKTITKRNIRSKGNEKFALDPNIKGYYITSVIKK